MGSGGVTAAELMARLRADDGYLVRKSAAEAREQARVEMLRRAEQPVLADLRAAGVRAESVWSLASQVRNNPAAVTVLLVHLGGEQCPDRVREAMARALASPAGTPHWADLRSLYLRAHGRSAREGLAVALAESAGVRHLDAMIDLLDEGTRGDTRIHLLRAIKRVGGDRGYEVLSGLVGDPLFGPEARGLVPCPEFHVYGHLGRATPPMPDLLACPAVEEHPRRWIGSRRAGRRDHPAFAVDGPAAVEPDEVPEQVRATIATADARFVVSVLDRTAASSTAAKRSSRSLADAIAGAVFEPRVDEVVHASRQPVRRPP